MVAGVGFVREQFLELVRDGGRISESESQSLLRALGDDVSRAVVHEVEAQAEKYADRVGPAATRRFAEFVEGRGGTGPMTQPELRGEDRDADAVPVYRELKGSIFRWGVSSDDVIQGAAGDCYFLSVLAGVADRDPKFIESAFQTVTVGEAFARKDVLKKAKRLLHKSAKDQPVHLVRLFQRNDRGKLEPVWVPVDTFFPVSQAQIVFASSRDKKELWVAMMEKAFATLMGSWDAISEGGHEKDAIEAITGREAAELTLAEENADAVWKRIERACAKQKLATAGTPAAEGEDEGVAASRARRARRPRFPPGFFQRHRNVFIRHRAEAPTRTDVAREDGIVPGHAYTILATRVTEDGARWIRLRNPWGETEPGPSTDLKTDPARRDRADDGKFWWSYERFLEVFVDATLET